MQKFPEVYIQIFVEKEFSKKICIMNSMISIIDGFRMTTGLLRQLSKVCQIFIEINTLKTYF
jgi:hypothetical protein